MISARFPAPQPPPRRPEPAALPAPPCRAPGRPSPPPAGGHRAPRHAQHAPPFTAATSLPVSRRRRRRRRLRACRRPEAPAMVRKGGGRRPRSTRDEETVKAVNRLLVERPVSAALGALLRAMPPPPLLPRAPAALPHERAHGAGVWCPSADATLPCCSCSWTSRGCAWWRRYAAWSATRCVALVGGGAMDRSLPGWGKSAIGMLVAVRSPCPGGCWVAPNTTPTLPHANPRRSSAPACGPCCWASRRPWRGRPPRLRHGRRRRTRTATWLRVTWSVRSGASPKARLLRLCCCRRRCLLRRERRRQLLWLTACCRMLLWLT